jgi:hypothetical protein
MARHREHTLHVAVAETIDAPRKHDQDGRRRRHRLASPARSIQKLPKAATRAARLRHR